MRVAFRENDGNHENDEQGIECWIDGNHGNHGYDGHHGYPGCKPRVPQTMGLKMPGQVPILSSETITEFILKRASPVSFKNFFWN